MNSCNLEQHQDAGYFVMAVINIRVILKARISLSTV